ncbi:MULTISPECIES: PP2C family protein-serine/threonine phosphatase [unclassified Blastococcus]
MSQVELTWGVSTHVGQRSENQDRCLAAPPLFAVADGMGGHAAGGAASEAAVTELAAASDGPTVAVAALRAALERADDRIRRLGGPDPELGAGTTVAGLGLIENGGGLFWVVFSIGDSRVYRWAAGTWEQISTDHSVVQELVDSGEISAAEAATHPQRHVVTRALGLGPGCEADYTVLPVEGGERFLLCSDGLTGGLPAERIAEAVAGGGDPQEVAERLVDDAVAAGADDNVSVVVVHAHRREAAAAGADVDAEAVTVPRLPADGARA